MAQADGHLLDWIFDAGERMIAALETEDLEAFFPAFEERTGLLQALSGFESPDQITPDWQPMARRMALQDAQLRALMSQVESEIGRRIAGHQTFKHAARSYAGAPGRPRQLLHRNLKG